LGFAIAGLGISLAYLIMSSIYHFFKAGFGMSIFGLITSSIYCYFYSQTLKRQRLMVKGSKPVDN
jgi:membrane associated rhomboid family serine protease